MNSPFRQLRVLDRARILPLLRERLALGLVALAGVMVTVGVLLVVQHRNRAWVLHSRSVLHLAHAANMLAFERVTGVRGYLIAGDSVSLARAVAAGVRLAPTLDSLIAVTADNPTAQTRARAVREALVRWDSGVAQPALAAAGRGDFATARAMSQRAGEALFDSVRVSSAALLAAEAARFHRRDRQLVRWHWLSGGVIALEIALLFLILARMRSRILAQAAELLQQQEQLEHQATELEEQAVELEQQMQELQDTTGELETSNHELGEALDTSRRAADLLRERDDELRRTTARLLALFSAAPLAICDIDAPGTVRSWNPAAVQMFGWTAGEAVGQPLRVLLGDDAVAREAAERHDGVSDVAAQGKRKDGTLVELSVSWGPLRDDGVVRGFVVTFADMTDRKRLEAQLIQAQKMEAVGRLAGGVAHDFNNMLTAIKSYSQLLLQDVSTDDAKHKDLREIDQAADRAARLTRQLLAFSRQQMLQPRLLDINQTVTELEKMLQRLLLKDIALVTVMEPDLHLVRADAGQVEQVIVNLVVNARDAMPDGGRLTVRTANVTIDQVAARARWPVPVRAGEYVLIAVADTGEGMDDATKSRIFEPFFTTKDRHKGTGLGLSTVYGIIKQSGGYIWVDSVEGRGTTFEIYLPQADAASEPAHTASRPTPRGGAETVLVVEDDDGIRAVIKRILERAGHRVIEAANGVDALRICETTGDAIDLVLSDISMPEMQGPDLARKIHERHPGIAMLLMSGYTDTASRQTDFLAPGVAFLGKPFSPDALTQKIRHILDGAA